MKKKYKKFGNKNNPRISIFRSNKEIYIQIIDDINSKTILSYSSLEYKKKKKNKKLTKIEMSKIVGKIISKKMKKKKIKKAFFYRKKYIYHGRIKYLIEEIRKNGILI
ncbi:MAG: 50S ribosomal protein L18 [Candidatus Shikimatogenerans bostrichidophilus]|nr:MAG: 50S ribosomal protein L18 [Candidatus Shikimatogenerans bostrichidophilus]